MSDNNVTIPKAEYQDLLRCKRLYEMRVKLMRDGREFWIRAGKAALAGDPRELRNRIALAEDTETRIELS